MADEDPKDDAKDVSDDKKTPVAEAAQARTKTTRRAAQKPAPAGRAKSANTDAKPKPGSGPDKAADDAKPDAAGADRDSQTTAGFNLPQSTPALAVVFAVVILVLIVIAWPGGRGFIAGLFSGPEDAERVALTERLGALEAALGRIEKDIAALKAGGEARAALDKRVTALESRPSAEQFGDKLDQSEKRLAGLNATIQALDARMAKAAQNTGTVALLALAGALRTGSPFVGLSARASAETAGDTEIAAALKPLAPFAETGVPTVEALSVRLETLKLPAAKASPPETGPKPDTEKPTGFWDKVKANVMKLGRIRKSPAKPAEAPGLETVRAATAEALVRGDLIAAAEAAKALPGPQAANWRRDLEARIKANAAASAIDHVIAARLGPAKGQR